MHYLLLVAVIIAVAWSPIWIPRTLEWIETKRKVTTYLTHMKGKEHD